MGFRKIAFPAFMLAASLYILLPTADEILIHPALGLLLSQAFHIPYLEGILLSVALWRVLGLSCLGAALATGGKPAYAKLKQSLSRKKPLISQI